MAVTSPIEDGLSDGESESPWWRPGRAAVIIFLASLIFILFVVWNVSKDSEWRKDEGWRIREAQP